MVGGLVVGVVTAVVPQYVAIFSKMPLAPAFILILLVLLFRPQGLFGHEAGGTRMSLGTVRLPSPGLATLLVLVVLPSVFPAFRVSSSRLDAAGCRSLGLNLLTGYNGQISVGHGALYGRRLHDGMLITNWRWPLSPAIGAAAVVCFLVGVLIGLPALRIKGLVPGLVTLAVATLFPLFLEQFSCSPVAAAACRSRAPSCIGA